MGGALDAIEAQLRQVLRARAKTADGAPDPFKVQTAERTRKSFDSIVQGVTMVAAAVVGISLRSEEHTSELQSLMRISYAVFCLKKKNKTVYIFTHVYVD